MSNNDNISQQEVMDLLNEATEIMTELANDC